MYSTDQMGAKYPIGTAAKIHSIRMAVMNQDTRGVIFAKVPNLIDWESEHNFVVTVFQDILFSHITVAFDNYGQKPKT